MPSVTSTTAEEQNDADQKMWNALKRYIIRERQRKKEEYEAEVEEERLRKEREARERQDVMTLGAESGAGAEAEPSEPSTVEEQAWTDADMNEPDSSQQNLTIEVASLSNTAAPPDSTASDPSQPATSGSIPYIVYSESQPGSWSLVSPISSFPIPIPNWLLQLSPQLVRDYSSLIMYGLMGVGTTLGDIWQCMKGFVVDHKRKPRPPTASELACLHFWSRNEYSIICSISSYPNKPYPPIPDRSQDLIEEINNSDIITRILKDASQRTGLPPPDSFADATTSTTTSDTSDILQVKRLTLSEQYIPSVAQENLSQAPYVAASMPSMTQSAQSMPIALMRFPSLVVKDFPNWNQHLAALKLQLGRSPNVRPFVDGVRFMPKEEKEYNLVLSYLTRLEETENISWEFSETHSQPSLKVIITGLPAYTPAEDVRSELRKFGFLPEEVHYVNAPHGSHGSIFLAILKSTENVIPAIYSVKEMLCMPGIKIKAMRGKEVTQCRGCQEYFLSSHKCTCIEEKFAKRNNNTQNQLDAGPSTPKEEDTDTLTATTSNSHIKKGSRRRRRGRGNTKDNVAIRTEESLTETSEMDAQGPVGAIASRSQKQLEGGEAVNPNTRALLGITIGALQEILDAENEGRDTAPAVLNSVADLASRYGSAHR